MTREELDLKRQMLLEKQKDLKGFPGDIFETTDGLFCTVLHVDGRTRFVEFACGFKTSTNLSNLKRGICKNRAYHKVWGVGVCEKGKHVAQVNGKGTKLYDHWTAMLNRCYNPNSVKYNRDRYADVTVDERFHYFQDFAEWCVNQIGYCEDFVLDKDMLSEGKRYYSPDHCVFVPPVINGALSNAKASRGEFPVGVHKETKSGKYIAQVNECGKRKCLGRFLTPESAFQAYKKYKEKQLADLADLWEDRVDPRVIEVLRNHVVKITD